MQLLQILLPSGPENITLTPLSSTPQKEHFFFLAIPVYYLVRTLSIIPYSFASSAVIQ